MICLNHIKEREHLPYIEWFDAAKAAYERGERSRQCTQCSLWYFPFEMKTERWLPVVGAPTYEVSDLGRVRSYLRPGRTRIRVGTIPRMRKLVPDREGYMQVSISIAGRVKMRKVHQLVLEAFVGPRPRGMLTRHKDRNPANNRLDNLLWGTDAENAADARAHGTHTIGEQNGGAKLTQVQADRIRKRLTAGERGMDLAPEYNVSQATISRVKKGRRYV